MPACTQSEEKHTYTSDFSGFEIDSGNSEELLLYFSAGQPQLLDVSKWASGEIHFQS